MNTIVWDGVKAIPLEDVLRPSEQRDSLSPIAAYHRVPWVRRCIQLRAAAVSAVPFEILSDGQPIAWPLAGALPHLLYLAESALCVYGSAYWLLVRRGRVLTDLRYLAPQTIAPHYDAVNGITAYERRLAGKTLRLSPQDVVAFFEPAPEVEIGPGKPLLATALAAAGMSSSASEYIASFFARGAIAATLLTVEGNPPSEELRRLESWWKRALSGVRRAWETAAVRASVKPVQIGITPNDKLDLSAIWTIARQQIAVAFGIPQTMLEDAANYATAREHRASFYAETIIPRLLVHEAALNAQLFAPLDLTFRFRPDQLEIFQQEESSKAAAVVQLVQAGIISIDEARQQMGIVQERPLATRALRDAMLADLRRWRDHVTAFGSDRAFTSDSIPLDIAALVSHAIRAVGVEVFGALKQWPDDRDEVERDFGRDVERDFKEHIDVVVEAILSSEPSVALDNLINALQRTVKRYLTRIVYSCVIRLTLETGISADPAVVNQAALEWAASYGYDLVRGITETTKKLISTVIQQVISTPGMTHADVVALLEPAFGSVRATTIATTEVTRAYAQATLVYQRLLADHGVRMVRIWQTSHDERVCPICGPLHDQPEQVWAKQFPAGPPAHVNCRCWTTLHYAGRKR